MTTLEVRNLRKNFGDVAALTDVSLTVKPGEIYGFVGSNGAGKSTTMRIILGVLAADAGEVLWDGKPITADNRRDIGYMPEERGLYAKEKILDQLVFLARLHGLGIQEATTNAQGLLEQLGLAERTTSQLTDLSLGNQQRVQLAASLVHNPDVLVLDEPFSGLDPIAVQVMSDMLISRAQQGTPVIFSSHQLDLVQRLCENAGTGHRHGAPHPGAGPIRGGFPRAGAGMVPGGVPNRRRGAGPDDHRKTRTCERSRYSHRGVSGGAGALVYPASARFGGPI